MKMDVIAPADDLSTLLDILPAPLARVVERDTNGLYEIVMDLGRLPEARYLDKHTVYLSDNPITAADRDGRH